MKKISYSIAALFLTASAAFSSVTLSIGFANLYQSPDTSNPAIFGARVNILALDSGSWGNSTTIASLFTNLTDSFVPTGATLVQALYTNDSDGPGSIGTTFIYNYSGGFTPGDELLMVVYPTLNNTAATPGLNTPGFFFRTNDIIDNSTMGWFAPGEPSAHDLFAYTLSLGGSLPNDQFTAGATATGGAGFTTIPEPSTFALLAIGSGAFLIMRKRRKLS